MRRRWIGDAGAEAGRRAAGSAGRLLRCVELGRIPLHRLGAGAAVAHAADRRPGGT